MESSFSVIRYITDPARNEPINVGIVLQCGERVNIRINREAIRRAITSDPQADESALFRLDSFLSEYIQQQRVASEAGTDTAQTINPLNKDYLRLLAKQSIGKLFFSESQFVDVPSSQSEDIDRTLNMLEARLVRPL